MPNLSVSVSIRLDSFASTLTNCFALKKYTQKTSFMSTKTLSMFNSSFKLFLKVKIPFAFDLANFKAARLLEAY